MKKSLTLYAFLFCIIAYGQVGIGTTTPNDDLDVVGDTQISGHLRVGNPTNTSTTYYGVYDTDWQGTISFDTNGYNYYDIGNFDFPTNIPTSVTVTKIFWEMDGAHEDGDEDHGVAIKIGTGTGGPWYGWAATSANGPVDVNWQYISNALSFSRTRGTVIRLRAEDEDGFGYGNDEMKVNNLNIKIHYQYTKTIEDGDISASGRVYANTSTDVGDLAEYFEVDESEAFEVGHIVVLKPESDNEYILSKNFYEQNIVGVISENPSVVLNNPKVGPPVALAGRVKVKLKKGQELIKSGDFLTTSDESGLAMIARESGPVIGYAVSNQKVGSDFVEILVQPGRFYMPPRKKKNRKPNQDIDGVNYRSR